MRQRLAIMALLASAVFCAPPASAQDRIGYTAADGVNTSYVTKANPLPVGSGLCTIQEPEAQVSMDGTWVLVWTASPLTRHLTIALPSDSGASGDWSANSALAGTSTSGGAPFAGGAGGSWDWAATPVPTNNVYAKATSGSKVTVQDCR